jgi:ribosomal protein S18 acetylase RimI-like enzyme/DNA-binding MarR family transcriptional regulator
LLRDAGRLGISELARELGQSHAAVSQTSRKLLKAKVVREWPDGADLRRRLLGLSPRGAAMMRRLTPVWAAITGALEEMKATVLLSNALTELDRAFSERSFSQRIYAHLHQADVSSLSIVPFAPRYAADFKRLNLEWLHKYFTVEPIDHAVLSRPAAIVRNGGFILFARIGKRTIGTCALLKQGESRYELSKMAVTESYQGLGIGRKLLEAAITTFAAHADGELFLETNSALTPAIRLYESMGFVHAKRPPGPSHYDRADVYMVYRGASSLAATRSGSSPRARAPRSAAIAMSGDTGVSGMRNRTGDRIRKN